MKVGIGLTRAATEGAKLAAHEADIGEINIAIDYVADDIADQVAAQCVGSYEQGEQVCAIAA
jgi:hypothetical protein